MTPEEYKDGVIIHGDSVYVNVAFRDGVIPEDFSREVAAIGREHGITINYSKYGLTREQSDAVIKMAGSYKRRGNTPKIRGLIKLLSTEKKEK